MDIRGRLHLLIDDILSDDPRAALIALREFSDHHLPWLEQRVVVLARREQWAWARIARLRGRSRQQIHKQFRTIAPTIPHDPMADHHRWEAESLRVLKHYKTGKPNALDDEVIGW